MSHQATDTVPLLEGPEQLCCGKRTGPMTQLKGKVRNFPKSFRLWGVACVEGAVTSLWLVLCPSQIGQAVEEEMAHPSLRGPWHSQLFLHLPPTD